MLRSNKAGSHLSPPLATQIDTSRHSPDILDDTSQRDTEDAHFNQVMQFVLKYELLKQEIGLASVVRTSNQRPPLTEATTKKFKGKVERPRQEAIRPSERDNPPSQDNSFRSQRKLNARPARQGPAEELVNPQCMEGSFGPSISPVNVTGSKPWTGISNFFTDSGDRPAPNASRFDIAPTQQSSILAMPNWADFQVEIKDPKQNFERFQSQSLAFPSVDHSLSESTPWQSIPFERINRLESPTFIKPVLFNQVRYSPLESANTRQHGHWSYKQTDPSSFRQDNQPRHTPPKVKRALRFQQSYGENIMDDEARSLYESPSRPFQVPPTGNKRHKQMAQSRSQYEFAHQKDQDQAQPASRQGNPIALLSVEHEFRFDRKGVRTSQQPLKHSHSHYLYREPPRQDIRSMEQQFDPEEEALPAKSLRKLHRPQTPPKEERQQRGQASEKSPQTPAEKEIVKPKKQQQKSIQKRGESPHEPPSHSKAKIFKESFHQQLKSLIGSKTVGRIHVGVQSPIANPRRRRDDLYHSDEEDDMDAAIDESLENMNHRRASAQSDEQNRS